VEKRIVKLQLLLTDSELRKIDDYRYENRVPSRSAAVRILLEESLTRWEEGAAPQEKSEEDERG